MKKLKRLAAVISSAVICGLSVAPILSNGINNSARNFYLSPDGYVYVEDSYDGKTYRCEEFPELTNYFIVDSSINLYPNVYYVSTELDKYNEYNIYFFQCGNMQIPPFTATFDFKNYWFDSSEKMKTFFKFISKNYPDLTFIISNYNAQEDKIYYTDLNSTDEIDKLFKNENETENRIIVNGYIKYGKDGTAYTAKERFQIMLDIYENTDCHAIMDQADSLPSSSDTLLSAGDTDLNGEVSINDAAQIMSFVTNKKQYPLSEMSQIVGDVYNTGDGINNMDALQIQRILANVE